MKFIKKLLEQFTIICNYDEEECAVEYLKRLGFTNIDFYHMEETIKVTGKQDIKVEKGEI